MIRFLGDKMNLELLKDLVKEHSSQDNAEKLDFIKHLERIKIRLRSELVKISHKNFGQWYIDKKTDTFSATSNISYLLPCKNFQEYLETFNAETKEKIISQLSKLEHLEQIGFQRDIKIGEENYLIQEKITYLKDLDIYIGALKDLTKIDRINKNIHNIDMTIYNMMKIFDKNIILIQCDKDGKINYVSSAFCETSNFSDCSVIGKNITDFKASSRSQKILDIFQTSLKSEKTVKSELKFKKKNGNYFWVKAFISPILGEDESNISFTLVCHDITSHKLLEDITNHDALTGVYNRRYYTEIINKEINRCKRDKKILSFAMIDINFFKQYNDCYGHRNGDEVLKKVATSLNNHLKRGGDYLFRMGGEEFCAVFSGYDDQKSLELCHKMREEVENLKIPHIGSKVSPFITVSIGLVVADLSNEVIDELGLYTTSDNALYSAKMSGRNKIHVHPHDSDIDFFEE